MALSPGTLSAIEHRVSPERLAPYRRACGGLLDDAIALYEWNTAISSAFWAVLSDAEVVIRNSMHEQLSTWSSGQFGAGPWYVRADRAFSWQARDDISIARRRAVADGRAETSGRVIAELSLGFWRFLLAARYERSLWLPCLRQAFPGLRGRGIRRDAYDALSGLHLLRNRIAHHEPIHNRPLRQYYQDVLAISGWICETTRDWIADRSQVPSLLALAETGLSHRM
jgi:hypothetical protein